MATAASLALAINPARASFAYAYSNNFITEFTVTGAVVTPTSTRTSNTATFDGFGTDAPPANPTDATEAFVGPAPPDGQNDFGRYGDVGQYARADSLITSPTLPFTGENVAEAFRSTSGAASAIATTGFNFTIALQANQAATITFVAEPDMVVNTGGSAFAVASIVGSLELDAQNADADRQLLWKPSGKTGGSDPGNLQVDAGSVSGVTDPFSLNATIVCGGDCFKEYDNPGSDTYSISYKSNVDEILNGHLSLAELVNVQVPEPASLALLGPAFLALAAASQRFRHKDREGHKGHEGYLVALRAFIFHETGVAIGNRRTAIDDIFVIFASFVSDQISRPARRRRRSAAAAAPTSISAAGSPGTIARRRRSMTSRPMTPLDRPRAMR